MNHRSLICAHALLLCACGTPRLLYDYSQEPNPKGQEFVIGAADELHINVWRNPELTVGNAPVRPDGTITMPLIGDIKAAGKTPSQLRQDIQQRLAAFFKAETLQVTVAITVVNSYRFTVNGNVERGGVLSAKGFMTVLEAITMAGGPNRFAELGKVIILRNSPTGERRIPINFETLRSGQQMQQNIVVLSGDVIYVP